MPEIILIVLIAISLCGILVYFLRKQKSSVPEENAPGRHIFVTNGVNMNTMQYGRMKGDYFSTDKLQNKTIMVEGNALPLCTVYLTNLNTGKEYVHSFRTEMYLGRARLDDNQRNLIVIEGDSNISKTHCRLRYLNHQVLIDDLNTPNHTYLNGSRITGTAVVNQNDELRIGDTRLNIRYRGTGK